LCRIISLVDSDESFGKNITVNNNRQNSIENRDFVSLDLEQIRIKNELLLDDIKYHITRSDFVASKYHINEFDLQEATIACACSCGEIDICTQSRREIGKIWEDTNSHLYTSLFNSSTSGRYVWYFVNLLREIDKVLEEIRLNNEALKGTIIYGNRLMAFLVIEELKKKDSFEFYTLDINKMDTKIIKDVVEQKSLNVHKMVEENYNGKILPSIFKNLKICSDMSIAKEDINR